jgi:putative ABC transport system permease protein
VDSRSLSVVGVIDTEAFDTDTELWVPIAFDANDEANHGSRGLQAFGRLKPGVSIETATAELKNIARRLETAYPETNKGWSIVVTTAHDALVGDYRMVILVLWGVVGFVLLIACANIANLLLARSMSRRRDVAIRLAIGASRFQIIRQLLAESIALAIAGGAVGLVLSHWTLRLLTLIESSPPGIRLEWIVFGFTAVLCVMTGILFGLIPALDLSRTDLNECLKDGSRSASASRRRHRIRNALVVAEVSLSLVLLIGAGLMMRSFIKLSSASPGFDPNNVLVGEVTFSPERFKGFDDVTRFTDSALKELSTIPGVLVATASDIIPFGAGSTFGMKIEGRPEPKDDQNQSVSYVAVAPRYFEAMKIPLKRGREFNDDDKKGSKLVTIVSESFARQFFPGENPIGKRIWFSNRTNEYREIIGIVGDTKQAGLKGTVGPQVYEALAQTPWPYLTFVLKTIDNPLSLTQAIEKRIQQVEPEQAVIVRSLETIVVGDTDDQRAVAISFAVFAGIALLIASTGLYGVIAHSVDQRTREIGLCMALGADRVRLLGQVLRQGLSLIAIGLLLGIAAAFALTHLLESFLFQTSTTDTATFVGISAVLALISLMACYVPARRASRVQPAVALRHE